MAQQFNTRAAVQFFGGPADLARRATKAGNKLTVKAIEKWTQRGQIPGVWLIRLADIATSEGRRFEINDFMGDTREAAA